MANNNSQTQGSTYPKLQKKDFEDDTCFRVNHIIELLFQQLNAVQGGSGPFSFLNGITAPSMSIPQTEPPKPGSNQVLTRSSADKLYAPQVVRESLIANSWQRIPALPYTGGGSGAASSGAPTIVTDTRAAMTLYPAANYAIGTIYWQSDYTMLYMVFNVGGIHVWQYISGMFRAVLASKPTGLGVNDAGLLFYGTDFGHIWRWSGSAWTFAPGDDGSGYIAMYTAAPNTPGSAAWFLIDGTSPTIQSLTDTTTQAITLAAIAGAFFKAGIAWTGATVAAGPTLVAQSGTGVTVASNTYDPTHVTIASYFRC